STVFAKRLIGDILLTPELRGEVEVMLHDIDTDRLKTSEIVTRRLAKNLLIIFFIHNYRLGNSQEKIRSIIELKQMLMPALW
ncbi:MAG: hypothetical protein QF832_22775, partial [SAR324 cluster bacterium]|nr:hypothetical protein [SAR324 cluster bacterium]